MLRFLGFFPKMQDWVYFYIVIVSIITAVTLIYSFTESLIRFVEQLERASYARQEVPKVTENEPMIPCKPPPPPPLPPILKFDTKLQIKKTAKKANQPEPRPVLDSLMNELRTRKSKKVHFESPLSKRKQFKQTNYLQESLSKKFQQAYPESA